MASGMNRHPVRKLRCRPGNRNPSFGQWLTRSRTIKTPRRLQEAAAGSGRSEHRNVDTLIPLARQRESPTGPNVPCERRTDPAEPPPPTSPRRQPQHSATAKQVIAPRGHAAFLQNAPVVHHTRGFTPGWYRGRDGRCRPPLPPNRTGGFPASGSPVGESPACGGTGAIGTG